MTDIHDTDHRALRLSVERPAATLSGYVMLLVLLLAIVVGVFGLGLAATPDTSVPGTLTIATAVLVFVLIWKGFYLLQPNQAAAILLFGSYKGTDRTTGLRWVLPWYSKSKVSTRARNVTSERLKVNDLRGNPI